MRKISLFFFLSCSAFLCNAQNVYNGKVTDENGLPLANVTVTLGKDVLHAITDTNGIYSFKFNSGNFSLSFSHVGFVTNTTMVNASFPPVIKLFRNNEFLDEAVVKAFERNGSLNSVPATVSVLNKASLGRYNGQSFVEAVNTVPGIKMDERSPGSYRLSIRGNLLRSTFGVRNVKVYWNGIPFTDASGNTYFNQLSPENIGRIEIIKGPSGSMYGSGTGGIVLMSTALSSVKEKNIAVQASAGSYGTFSTGAAYTQSGKNSTNISFDHQQSDGYRMQTNMRRDVANYTGSYLLNAKQRVSANIFYSDLYYETPGGLTLNEMLADPRQARPAAGAFPGAEAQKAAIYLKTIYAGISHEYRFNRDWSNTTSVYGSYTGFKNPTIRNYEDKYERGIGGRTVFQYKGKLLTHTIGGEYQSGFINTGVYGNRLGIKDTLQYNDEINSRQYNVFAQSEFTLLEDLIFTAGISYNNFHYGLRRMNEVPLVKRNSDFSPQVIPRIAALIKIDDRVSVYATVSKGYSPPSIDEVHASDGIFNTALKAETGINYEAGVKGDIVKNKLWIDAAYYIFHLQNTIVSRRDSSGADFYVNAGKTKQRGVEISLNYLPINNEIRFIRQLKVWTNYTHIHARFSEYQQGADKFDGNKLTGTPPDVFVAGADIVSSPGTCLNLTYSYTSRLPLNDANTFWGTSYNLLFVKLGHKIKFHDAAMAEIFAVYQHSFNDPYSLGNDLNAAGNRYFNPSAPSVFSAGAKFRFAVK